MKIKIDENLSRAHRRLLDAAGHEVADVYDEGLSGVSDDVLWSRVTGWLDRVRAQPGYVPIKADPTRA